MLGNHHHFQKPSHHHDHDYNDKYDVANDKYEETNEEGGV